MNQSVTNFFWHFLLFNVFKKYHLNLLAPELFLIFAHPVYKMWKIQEPNRLEVWNKMHFEEKKSVAWLSPREVGILAGCSILLKRIHVTRFRLAEVGILKGCSILLRSRRFETTIVYVARLTTSWSVYFVSVKKISHDSLGAETLTY